MRSPKLEKNRSWAMFVDPADWHIIQPHFLRKSETRVSLHLAKVVSSLERDAERREIHDGELIVWDDTTICTVLVLFTFSGFIQQKHLSPFQFLFFGWWVS